MGRVPRWRLSEGVYHVYNRGLSSAMILPTDDEKDLFCDLGAFFVKRLPLL